MNRLTLAALLLAVPTATLAQSIDPLVIGEGTQTQSVQLLQGAVSVTVQSSGSLTAGQGQLDGSAGLSVDVNGLAVSVGNPGGGSGSGTGGSSGGQTGATPTPVTGSGAGAGAGTPSGQQPGTTTPAPGATAVPNTAAAASSAAVAPSPVTECSPNLPDLSQVPDGTAVQMLPMARSACTDRDSLARWIAGEPRIVELLRSAAVAPEDVVAITFSGNSLTIGVDSAR